MTPAKHTRPAKNAAHESEPTPPTTAATPLNSFFDPADIPRTHELIVDAVTEMLTRGGHPDDVDGMLRATMAHTRRRTAPESNQDGPHIAEFIREKFNKWKHELIIAWSKNKKVEAPAFEANTISDRIRVNARESLWLQFATFMDQATPEEIRFLLEILNRRNDRAPGAEESGDEILLANSFEIQIQRDEVCYLKVPELLVKEGQKYIDALRAIDEQVHEEAEDYKDIERARAARLAIVSALVGLKASERDQVRAFIAVVKANRNNALTPIEDFLCQLPKLWERQAEAGRGLTPDEIIRQIDGEDGVRSWFDDALSITRDFSRRYAKVVAIGAASGEGKTA